MEDDKRDELLIRLDERSERFEEKLDTMSDKLDKLNGDTRNNTIGLRWVKAAGGTILTLLIGWLAKIQGLW